MRRAFTLMEMVVALGIMALVLSFAGVIFRVSIESYRLAAANAEIMQKLRVLTAQLERDFDGALLQYDSAMEVRQLAARRGGKDVPVNSDAIALFVSGDFQTLKTTYKTFFRGEPISGPVFGNVACVRYEQPDPNSYGDPAVDNEWSPSETILLRRETILAGGLDPNSQDLNSGPHEEYYLSSLAQWRANPPFTSSGQWFLHPRLDLIRVEDYQPTYLACGVDNFTIEYAERDPATNRPKQDATGAILWRRDVMGNPGTSVSLYAFRFTFTLYDSKGLIANGRPFTHVIVLGD